MEAGTLIHELCFVPNGKILLYTIVLNSAELAEKIVTKRLVTRKVTNIQTGSIIHSKVTDPQTLPLKSF